MQRLCNCIGKVGVGSEGEEAFETHANGVVGGFIVNVMFEVGVFKGVYVVGDGEEG